LLRTTSARSHHDLLLALDLAELLTGSHHVLVLDAHNTTAPCASKLLVLVVLLVEGLGQRLEVLEIFLAHLSEGEAGGGLLVDELAKVGLAADEAVGDARLAAKGGEEDHHLDGVDVVGDHNELGTVLLNELGDVIEAELNVDRLGTNVSGLLAGGLNEAIFLFGAGLRAIFGEQFKEFTGLVTLNGAVELSDSWWDLEALHQNTLLALNTDVLGPPDEAGEVSLRLDVSSDSKVAWVLFEQRIFCCGVGA